MINEQYFRFPRRLLDSPTLRVLTINERRALDRILSEHQSKSGYVNDGLPVTSKDFECAGVHPRRLTQSLRVLVALGIIECTRSMTGSSSGRRPNLWRPTFLPRTPKTNDATHDYLKIKTVAEAKKIAAVHRIPETRSGPPSPKRRKRLVSIAECAS